MKTISRAYAKEHFDELLDAVIGGHATVIVERDGREVVVIGIDAYRHLVDAQAARDWDIIDRVRERNQDKNPEGVERDVAEAVAEERLA